jgi:hypothetical protein
MNRLEAAVQHDLAGALAPPPVAAVERRAQRRRARELAAGGGAAVVVAALAVAGFVWTRPTTPVRVATSSPSTSTSTLPPTTRLPIATTAVFPKLEQVESQARAFAASDGPVSRAEIVATTRDKVFVLFGGKTDDHRRIYLVKLVGRFVCDGCSVPAGGSAPHGDRIYFVVQLAPGSPDSAFSIGSRDVDLSVFGKVYRLPGYPG